MANTQRGELEHGGGPLEHRSKHFDSRLGIALRKEQRGERGARLTPVTIVLCHLAERRAGGRPVAEAHKRLHEEPLNHPSCHHARQILGFKTPSQALTTVLR